MTHQPKASEGDRVAEASSCRSSELDDIEMTLAIESAGVAQAADALDKVKDCQPCGGRR
jgi:hypothetical protein